MPHGLVTKLRLKPPSNADRSVRESSLLGGRCAAAKTASKGLTGKNLLHFVRTRLEKMSNEALPQTVEHVVHQAKRRRGLRQGLVRKAGRLPQWSIMLRSPHVRGSGRPKSTSQTDITRATARLLALDSFGTTPTQALPSRSFRTSTQTPPSIVATADAPRLGKGEVCASPTKLDSSTRISSGQDS